MISFNDSDNLLIELAVAGGATFVVPRNLRHLEHMGIRFPELRIASPETFLKEI